jgi:hypothetical protein
VLTHDAFRSWFCYRLLYTGESCYTSKVLVSRMRSMQKSRHASGWREALMPICAPIAAWLFFASAANAERICFSKKMSAEQCAVLCAAKLSNQARLALRKSGDASAMQNMSMSGMKGMNMPLPPAAGLLMQEVSGTTMNPASAPMAMRMMMRGNWNLDFMGYAFVTDTQQSGPRGGDKLYSTNVFMGTAEHAAGRGALLFDLMLSLEPATISDREYPELFQTGETAFGKPIEDGQHPHNFLMGTGVHYARPIGENAILEAYFAPVGDPALGPVAYPHRASAAELPEAPIGHHWEDSTHISYEVATIGLKYKIVRMEMSGFHGGEPNENRWNIGAGAMDSWSARLSLFPTENWTMQASVGRLAHPESYEPGDIVRTTASVEYSRPLAHSDWSTSFIFGRNHKTANGADTDAFLIESVAPIRKNNFLTGRWELVDKDDLFGAQPAVEQQLLEMVGTTTFRIGEYTAGYTRYFPLWTGVKTGFGANFSTYTLPAAIVPFYGAHPFGVNVYLHLQLKPDK